MREIILGIALIAIATGIFKLLCPHSSFKKQIGFLIASFFLLSILSLINSEAPDFSAVTESLKKEGAYIDFTEEAYKMTQQEIANKLAEDLEEKLRENNIFCKEIRVIIDISSAYSISIKQVRLAFTADRADTAEAAEAIVKKEVGNEIQVVAEIHGR
ncbi:MAG TPA: hypothetical protein DDX91_01025 [Ruminococcaceae bacterium]|nr:hypothetical protein [Oscillospiraceae bacterium]